MSRSIGFKRTRHTFPSKAGEKEALYLPPFTVTDGRDGCPQVPAGGFFFPWRRLADIFCRIFLHSPAAIIAIASTLPTLVSYAATPGTTAPFLLS